MSFIVSYSKRWVSPEPLMAQHAKTATAAIQLVQALQEHGWAVLGIRQGEQGRRILISELTSLAEEEAKLQRDRTEGP